METTAYIALSRQLTLLRQMEVTANNIANMSSSGYKAESLLLEQVPIAAGDGRRLAFVQDRGMVRDLGDGATTATGNPFDLAISGPGYLVVQAEAGERYTRAGQLRVGPEGVLVDIAGRPVLDEGGAPVPLPEGAGRVEIAADGTLSGDDGPFGRLQVVEFERPQALVKEGGGLYRTDEPPLPAEASSVVQGMLEASNVQGVLEITRMMETLRAFQGAQRLIEIHHEGKRRAIERMMSVNA
jgi:flagellar basal-body rod protein FlgF